MAGRAPLSIEEFRRRQQEKTEPGFANGPELRKRRQATGLKIPAFAAEVGFTPNAYRNIEILRHKASPEAMHRIANRLGCPLTEIFIGMAA